MTGRHAHEMEAAGEVRWTARLKDGLVLVTDKASGEEFQATAYTIEGENIHFSLPGDGGLRNLKVGEPGFDAFKKVIGKSPHMAESEKAASKPANEKAAADAKLA